MKFSFEFNSWSWRTYFHVLPKSMWIPKISYLIANQMDRSLFFLNLKVYLIIFLSPDKRNLKICSFYISCLGFSFRIVGCFRAFVIKLICSKYLNQHCALDFPLYQVILGKWELWKIWFMEWTMHLLVLE